jgi:beta propeller repeat protein
MGWPSPAKLCVLLLAVLASSLASGCGDAGETSAGHRIALPAASDGAAPLVVWEASRDAGDSEESEVVAARMRGEDAPVVLSEGAWAKCTAHSSRWLAWEQTGIRKDGLPAACVYDLDTGRRAWVDRSSDRGMAPMVSGSTLVWLRVSGAADDESRWDLMSLQLPSGTEKALVSHPWPMLSPAIAGSWVVWGDRRRGAENSDIYGYDLDTGKERVICAAPGSQQGADVSGSWVVWADYRRSADNADIYENADIYGYDLDTGEERLICDAPGSQVFPAVSGSWVIWADYRRGPDNADIYGYNLDTGEERLICDAPGSQVLPDISGSWVVWTDYRRGPGNADIYGYDLRTGMESVVCKDPGNQTNPLLPSD